MNNALGEEIGRIHVDEYFGASDRAQINEMVGCRRGTCRDRIGKLYWMDDPHSPSEFRVNGVVGNVDAWYKAFDVKSDDDLHLPPRKAREKASAATGRLASQEWPTPPRSTASRLSLPLVTNETGPVGASSGRLRKGSSIASGTPGLARPCVVTGARTPLNSSVALVPARPEMTALVLSLAVVNSFCASA